MAVHATLVVSCLCQWPGSEHTMRNDHNTKDEILECPVTLDTHNYDYHKYKHGEFVLCSFVRCQFQFLLFSNNEIKTQTHFYNNNKL